MARNDTSISRLLQLGISHDDATALRRISMTLRRWHELECGNSDNWKSWAIERDGNEPDSKPFMVIHPHTGAPSYRNAIPDRETGARKRLARIMANYPTLRPYVQGDPRGCALHILRPGDVPAGSSDECCYTNGVAVY